MKQIDRKITDKEKRYLTKKLGGDIGVGFVFVIFFAACLNGFFYIEPLMFTKTTIIITNIILGIFFLLLLLRKKPTLDLEQPLVEVTGILTSTQILKSLILRVGDVVVEFPKAKVTHLIHWNFKFNEPIEMECYLHKGKFFYALSGRSETVKYSIEKDRKYQ